MCILLKSFNEKDDNGTNNRGHHFQITCLRDIFKYITCVNPFISLNNPM